MRIGSGWASLGLAAALVLAPWAARAECKLAELAEFHVDPNSRVPIVDGEVNGKPVKVMFDTGSTFSMVPRSEAERLGLILGRVEGGHAMSLGGQSDLYITLLKNLKIGGYAVPGMQIYVAGDRYERDGASLVLGDDFFSQVDAEFDLPHNAVRLFRHEGCAPAQLDYWGAAYSQATLLTWNRDAPAAQTLVFVNGKRALAQFDTGAEFSTIDVKLAALAGVERSSAGSQPGEDVRGFGLEARDSFIGAFATFAVGDEKVNNVHLQVLDLTSDFSTSVTGTHMAVHADDTASMFIGADFFRAHRIYFDVADHLVLFSYSGGPVFSPAPAPPAAQ